MFGQGVEQNLTEAAKWFRNAAERGLAEAQHSLAVAYSYGKGVPQNDVQAVKWFAEAAAQGYPRAQYSLGLMIMRRREGVPQDVVEALKWLKLAARKGHRGAIKGVKKLTKNVAPNLVAEMTKDEAEAERRVKRWRPRVQPDRGLPVWW